jgi:hypothetical protein
MPTNGQWSYVVSYLIFVQKFKVRLFCACWVNLTNLDATSVVQWVTHLQLYLWNNITLHV